jgi:uncharacterized RDD family membrane protein YckC
MDGNKPSFRERPWYAVAWAILVVGIGLWALFCVFLAIGLLGAHPTTMEAGFTALGWEIFLAISFIPICCLFLALIYYRPTLIIKTSKKAKDDSRYNY